MLCSHVIKARTQAALQAQQVNRTTLTITQVQLIALTTKKWDLLKTLVENDMQISVCNKNCCASCSLVPLFLSHKAAWVGQGGLALPASSRFPAPSHSCRQDPVLHHNHLPQQQNTLWWQLVQEPPQLSRYLFLTFHMYRCVRTALNISSILLAAYVHN